MAAFVASWTSSDLRPSMLVSHKKTHPCREFVMVRPCCSSDVWQLRCLVKRDSIACASSVDDCIRGSVAMIRNVGLSPPNAGARLIGQSLGACMALQLVKVMIKTPRQRRRRTMFRRVPIESPCTETNECLCCCHWS